MDRISPKKVFPVDNGKSEHHHSVQHTWLSLGSKFQLKLTVLIFGSILSKKVFISDLKQKNCTFVCAHGRYLLYQTFPQGDRQTQWYFNVSSLSSSTVCDWFVNNKLSIDFGEDKTKCILFGTKHGLTKVSSLEIKYGENTLSSITQ